MVRAVLLPECMRALVLPVLGLVLNACGDDPTEMPERAACIDQSAANRYVVLTPSPDVDGIGFGTVTAPASATPVFSTLAVAGKACATATDRPACESRAYDTLHDAASPSWQPAAYCPGPFCAGTVRELAVIIVGDDVRVATLADVGKAIAPIETRDEASALLAMNGRYIDCNANNVREDADGWMFKWTTTSKCGTTEVFTKVGRDGVVTPKGGRVISNGPLCELLDYDIFEGGV